MEDVSLLRITDHQLYMHYNQSVIDDTQLIKIIYKPVDYDTQLVIMHTQLRMPLSQSHNFDHRFVPEII